MDYNINKKHRDTIIIGGGQAGLAVGYYLKKLNEDFLILDENSQVGDIWRNRWDSLKLFTPAQYDGLPGLPYPANKGFLPAKDEMADYLEVYAKQFELPIATNVRVSRLAKNNSYFEIKSTAGTYISENVIVSTGTNPAPYIPEIANLMDSNIHQIHSSQYRNPLSLPPGDVLIVGSGTSGIQIAIELSKSRLTFISGKPTFHIPDWLFKYAGGTYWWFINNILTDSTPIGRKVRKKSINKGTPLISVKAEDLNSAGVERLPRTLGVNKGYPKLENGRTIYPSVIIWSTGYKPDFSWIEFNATDETGWPAAKRGVSELIEGLYFMGMKFQYGLTSGLIGGVGRDAEFIANYIHNHKSQLTEHSFSTEVIAS